MDGPRRADGRSAAGTCPSPRIGRVRRPGRAAAPGPAPGQGPARELAATAEPARPYRARATRQRWAESRRGRGRPSELARPGVPGSPRRRRSRPAALRVQAAHRRRVGDPLDGEEVRAQAHVTRGAFWLIASVSSKALTMISLSFALTIGLAPVVAVEVLDPLEVADRHAAGVAQDVRDQEDAAVVEDRRRRPASSGRWPPRQRSSP